MKTISFRAYDDTKNDGMNLCSREVLTSPIVVNCMGNFRAKTSFHSINPRGRKDYYLILIISGELEFIHESGSIKAGAGSLIIHPPRIPYEYKCTSPETDYLWVHFTGCGISDKLSDYKIKTFPEVNDLTVDGDTVGIFKSMFRAFAIQDELRDYELACLLDRLLIFLSRRISDDGFRSARPMLRAIEYINSSYDEKIKIPDLALMENLSVSRFNTLFKKTVGIPPTEYIARVRIDAATDLLSNTSLSIAEIGETVGYDDPHFFSRIFTKYKGESPTSYRQRNFFGKGEV